MTPEKRLTAIETGRRLRMFVQDEAIVRWFECERLQLIAEMIGADPADDDSRRAAALQIRALDGLLASIKTAADRADRLEMESDNV